MHSESIKNMGQLKIKNEELKIIGDSESNSPLIPPFIQREGDFMDPRSGQG